MHLYKVDTGDALDQVAGNIIDRSAPFRNSLGGSCITVPRFLTLVNISFLLYVRAYKRDDGVTYHQDHYAGHPQSGHNHFFHIDILSQFLLSMIDVITTPTTTLTIINTRD
jgi:hypothetical protein